MHVGMQARRMPDIVRWVAGFENLALAAASVEAR